MAMPNLQLTRPPIATTGMLIRRPIEQVFQAFVDPAITTQFWFTRSTGGPLVLGAQVQWHWDTYGVSIPVTVRALEPNQRILIEWPGYAGAATTVEWRFTARPDGATFVIITNAGFTGTGDELVKQATDSTEGFTLVLAGLKALLEHGVKLNLVADRYPKGIDEH